MKHNGLGPKFQCVPKKTSQLIRSWASISDWGAQFWVGPRKPNPICDYRFWETIKMMNAGHQLSAVVCGYLSTRCFTLWWV